MSSLGKILDKVSMVKSVKEGCLVMTDDHVLVFQGLKPVLSVRDNMDLEDNAEMLDCAEMEHLNLPFLEREIISAPF